MSLLCNLPEAMLVSALSDWLTIVDIARLDSSICNAGFRPDYLNAAYNSGALLAYPLNIFHSEVDCNDMNVWIVKKGAVVDGFFVTDALLNNSFHRERYLRQHGAAIQWVEFMLDPNPYKDYRRQRSCARDIAQYCPKLTRFDGQDWHDEEVLTKVAQGCPLLEEVRLISNDCTSDVVLELAKHCTKLISVHLLCSELSEESLIALVRSNPGLQNFTTSAEAITNIFLDELVRSCVGLTVLTLSDVAVEEASLHSLLAQCKHLQTLRLDDCAYAPCDVTAMTAQPVTCSSLQRLYLLGLDISADETSALLSVCPGLTSLEIHNCHDLVDSAMLQIGAHCPQLRTLTMYNNSSAPVTDEVLLDIATKCVHLRAMEIPSCDEVTTAGLIAVVKMYRKLEVLVVQDSNAVTDEFLAALAQCGSTLELLFIDGCTKVSDVGVVAVMQGCSRLAELGVEGCAGLTTQVVQAIARRFPETAE